MKIPTEEEMKEMMVKKMATGLSYDDAMKELVSEYAQKGAFHMLAIIEKVRNRSDDSKVKMTTNEIMAIVPTMFEAQATNMLMLSMLLKNN